MQSCFFANLNLIISFLFAVAVPKLPIGVIQKFCYHGNVTSHFPSLSCGFVCLFVYFSRIRSSQNSKIWTFSILFSNLLFFPLHFFFVLFSFVFLFIIFLSRGILAYSFFQGREKFYLQRVCIR